MIIRPATINDLTAIVDLLADDDLGKLRENFQTPLSVNYLKAFKLIELDSNQELVVVEKEPGEIIGTLQLSFIQYLTYEGGIRAQIEAVRIRKDYRKLGIGKDLCKWAIARAKARNAHLVQLTTDKKRPVAIKFYKNLGFESSHEGLKLHFSN